MQVNKKRKDVFEKPIHQNSELPSHLLHKKFTVNAKKYGISTKNFSNNAIAIVNKLSRNGFEAYIVGGCLRDILLDREPKDFDITTNARPEEIKQIFGRQCRLIGRRFRLAHIVYGREVYEVATFRANPSTLSNQNEVDNNIAKTSNEGMLLRDNVYGSLKEDAQRRDFSVNALYFDVKHNLIFDFFEGIKDIQAGKLRLIGDPNTRYQEDPVRMLRAIRFMAKLDMFLEKSTELPIYQLTHLLNNIPAARLFDESLKLLQSGSGVKTYQLLREYHLFEILFPTIACSFTEQEDSYAEKMIIKALTSTDNRIQDNLRINPAFLYAALLWYPMREKMDELKNEGGLNTHDAMMLAANEILAETCNRIALHRRHTAVIRDIWQLQFRMTKRVGRRPYQTLEHIKFRAGFDLLVMRAEIEGGDLVELSAWWHEFQLSNEVQRTQQINSVKSFQNGDTQKRKPRRKRHYKNRRKPKTTTSVNE
ncbi:polynucleotide adenylyltransferase PcnB [Pasteurella skyensis]|uniref:Poly(A) polymerase I n=1 Tax=Phocoenobacter skyensis TaxID=97481 RepID=A0AAJ6NBJ9_9PAST|nr:polynucleotide adenylyltransferase PcnB [Pasteurella skyensis]MDP8163482.1 polynucleotide adenylyltransferase PcnB [Pasteurella skyensis]MDP8173797.1 polynucleotide adenylyltransferase PcnB [Pasteurella skyensis]MDP8177882.1 polynucleotide adenylyltransferase PcnB [Pasteurella skyensis]MDP8179946.1 polynucleotide adenylyltransferase PcnB [Pasteurella skyensis]MDP8184055.1 polynucleotide adenylyltransferase PcnB [Pasteurella skyensis]